MKIVLVTETFPPEVNGVAMTLKRLVEGVARLGDDITVVRPRQPADRTAGPTSVAADAVLDPRGDGRFREVLVPGLPLPRYEGLMIGWPVLWRLLRLWSADRPDVVHVATEGPLGWAALGATARLAIPTSSSFHTNFHQYGQHYGYGAFLHVAFAYLRSFHNETAVTMVPTRQMQAELRTEGFWDPEVVSRGVDTALFSPARRSEDLRRSWGAAPGAPVFLYVGRIAKEKNIELAVQGFLAARVHHADARFVLVGDGPEREALQARYPEFHFAGMQRGEALAAHYASGDVFLFPSVTETFGNVVTEALASGLVVVTYDYAAGREHIRHGANGILAPFDDPAAYRAAVVDIAARPADWPAIRAGARATALGVTWDAIIARFRATLAAVASLHRGNGECV
ncbi:MAG: glycosyltransferase family 1 protein [Opitutaceae bacterium]|nr:glycosyltransferase family 1 protein [Opitutaceae bacterium]